MPGVINKRGNRTLEKISSKLMMKHINDPQFKAKMAAIKSVAVNKEYDIPYLSGYSKTGKTVYIDRHLKTEWEGHDLTQFLRIHEVSEKTLLDLDHLTYQQAHHIATHLERMAVEKAGINWRKYSKYLDPYIKRVHVEDLFKVPKDLDIEPYKDEKDKMVLAKLMKKTPKSTIRETIRETAGLPLHETKISLEYHDELNPKIWDGFKLKPEVRSKLLQFAHTWAEFAKIPNELIQDIIMIGGNANYNYTTKSDIDVHVIIDRDKLNPNREFVDEYLQDKKVLWTLTHKISILGYPIEPYAQDSSASYPRGQGVYSLKRDTWVQTPPRGKYDFASDPSLKKKVLFYVHLINTMIDNKMDVSAFRDLKKKISDMRASSIAKGGEFGFENLVFKELRNRGMLDRMNKYETSIKDQELSLK